MFVLDEPNAVDYFAILFVADLFKIQMSCVEHLHASVAVLS